MQLALIALGLTAASFILEDAAKEFRRGEPINGLLLLLSGGCLVVAVLAS